MFVFTILLPPTVLDMPLDGSRSYLYGFGNIFHASGFSPFAAIFPVLAYAAVYCEEHNSGYLRMVLHRAGYPGFMKVRAITVACSGGIWGIVIAFIVHIGGYELPFLGHARLALMEYACPGNFADSGGMHLLCPVMVMAGIAAGLVLIECVFIDRVDFKGEAQE